MALVYGTHQAVLLCPAAADSSDEGYKVGEGGMHARLVVVAVRGDRTGSKCHVTN